MLKKLKLHNFRTYLNAEIDFKQRHLLIGRNNSGKTNLVSAIRFLGATSRDDLNTASGWVPGGILEMRNWNLDQEAIEMTCVCELEYEGDLCEFEYELAMKVVPTTGVKSSGQMELRVSNERLLLRSGKIKSAVLLENDGHEAKMLHEEQEAKGEPDVHKPKTLAPPNATMLSRLYELESNRRAILFRQFLSSWMIYNLSPMAMRTGWQGKTAIDTGLYPFGENLANVLFRLKNLDEIRYRRLIDHVKLIEPDLEALISQAREGMRQDYRNSKTGGYWRVPKSFGLIEHEYDDAIPAERFKENWEAVELCLRNFASSPILADIKASDPDRYRSIDTLDSFQIDGVPIWAAPDFAYERPNGRLIIVDWKTGAARPEDDFQLAGYAAYAEQRWGYPPSWVLGALVYLKTGEVRRVPVERSVVDDFQAKARVSIGEMRSVLTDVEGNEAREADFARTEHVGRCYGCPFRIECWPAGRVVDGGRPSAQSLSSS